MDSSPGGDATVTEPVPTRSPDAATGVSGEIRATLAALVRAVAAACDVPLAVLAIGGSDRFGLTLRSDPGLPETPEERHLMSQIPRDGAAGTVTRIDHAAAGTVPGALSFCAGLALRAADGRRLGQLCVLDRVSRVLSGGQSQAMRELALAVEHLLIQAGADSEAKRLRQITTVQKRLADANLDLDDFLDAVLVELETVTPATGAILVHVAPDGLIVKAASGTARDSAGIRFSRDNSLCGLCITTGESYISADCDADPRVAHANTGPFGTKSIVVAPLSRDGAVFGCLMLVATTPYAFRPAHLQTLELITGMLSAAFERRLRQDNERNLLAKQSLTLGELASLERQLRAATSHSATGMALISPTGEFLQVNEALCRLFGYAADELVGSNILDLTPPSEIPTIMARVDRLLSGEVDTYQVEKDYRRKDGSVASVLQSLSIVRTPDGTPEFVVTEFLDIGARKQAEAAAQSAIRQLNEANRLLVMGEEMAQLGHWRFDVATRGLFWSEELFRIHGRPRHLGTPNLEEALQYYHPDDRDHVAAYLAKVSTGGEGYRREDRLLRSDGTLRFVSAIGQCERDADGRITGVFGVFQDVTERKESERTREALNTRLLHATHAGRVGIWDLDHPDGEVTADNVMRALYGLEAPLELLTTADWWAAMAPEDAEISRSRIAACWRGEKPYDFEYRVDWPNGEIRYLHSRGTVVQDADGKPTRIIGTTWDVTENRNLTLQLAAEKERAEQANLAKSNFLAMMSHEIRTPMNGIMGMSALLLLDSQLTPQHRRMAEAMRYSADALLAIIDDILDLSKLEADKIDLEDIAFDPADLVARAVETVSHRAQQRGLTLSVETRITEARQFRGDPSRLRQILLNLLGNAVKFTEIGAVTVTASDRRDAAGRIRLRIDVEDTGIGVSQENRDRLFQPFEQADSSIARRFGGTGLGLSICKRLVERMAGEIGIIDRAGGGSHFWFEVPLVEAPDVAEPPIATMAGPNPDLAPAGQGRILLAEDNLINIEFATMVLESRGYVVDVAADGFEAIAAAERGGYDLVLMDMQMPRLDGLSATRRIRVLEGGRRKLPIVAMTANAMREDALRCLEAGMDDYIAKPIDPSRLCSIVARWIERGRERNL